MIMPVSYTHLDVYKRQSVLIDRSVMQKACGDEKTAKWLEENLAIMPDVIRNAQKAAIRDVYKRQALSIEEAADYTGIGRNTLRKLVEWKKLPVLKVGRKVLIKTDILEKFIRYR